MKKFELLDYVLLFVVIILATIAVCFRKSSGHPGLKEVSFTMTRTANGRSPNAGADN